MPFKKNTVLLNHKQRAILNYKIPPPLIQKKNGPLQKSSLLKQVNT